jgi:hypothetical protein
MTAQQSTKFTFSITSRLAKKLANTASLAASQKLFVFPSLPPLVAVLRQYSKKPTT